MHYRDGTLAQVGDVARFTQAGTVGIGIVKSISPGSTTCNAQLAVQLQVTTTPGRRVVVGPSAYDWTITLGEASLVL